MVHAEIPSDVPREVKGAVAKTEALDHSKNTLDIIHFKEFMSAYGNHRVLEREEEVALGRQIQRGLAISGRLADGEVPTEEEKQTLTSVDHSRQTMLLHNIRLAAWVMLPEYERRPLARRMSRMDLMSEALMGVMTAIDQFDPERGCKFSTKASKVVWKAIDRAIENQAQEIRIPVGTLDTMRKLGALDKEGLPAAEIMSTLGIKKPDRLQELRQAQRINDLLRLDGPVFDNAEHYFTTYGAIVTDPSLDVESEIITGAQHEELARVLSLLPAAEARVIDLRFGFTHAKPMGHIAVAKAMGIKTSEVKQLEGRAISLLKDYIDDPNLFF